MDPFVSRHLQGVSRTYAILVPMLPRELAQAIGVAYLVMRVVDTIEDDPALSRDQRVAGLDEFESALAAPGRGTTLAADPFGETPAERVLMADVAELLQRVHALEPAYREPIRHCAGTMSAGVKLLQERAAVRGLAYPAVRDAAEMREYCYYVAGVVGEMLCGMMGHYLKRPTLTRLRGLAVELGIGLQLVNILKDALKDSRHNRRYLPQAADGGVSHAEVYRAVLGEARGSLWRGVEFVLALPATARELRSFCGLPIAWGAMTLAQAEQDATRAKIGRSAIQTSIEFFSRVASDDGELRRWFGTLLGSPAPQPAAAQ